MKDTSPIGALREVLRESEDLGFPVDNTLRQELLRQYPPAGGLCVDIEGMTLITVVVE